MIDPSKAPTDKVAATTATGALALLLAWILEQLGVAMPPQVQLALAVLLMAAAGYIKTERGALAAALRRKGPGDHAA